MFIRNLEILQALAKGTNPHSPRNYAAVIGWDGEKFEVTDGYKIMAFRPIGEDSSFPFPKEKDPLRADLIGRSNVKFPKTDSIWEQARLGETLSEKSRDTLERVIREGGFKKQPFYFEPDTCRMATDVEGRYGVNLVQVCELKKMLPKGWMLMSAAWSAKDNFLRLEFSHQLTAVIVGVDPHHVREQQEIEKKRKQK